MYKVITITTDQSLEAALNKESNEGWELVTMTAAPGPCSVLVLKRTAFAMHKEEQTKAVAEQKKQQAKR